MANVGQVLTSVRPLMGPFSRGPVWEWEDQVQINQACSRHLVATGFPDLVSRPLCHTFLLPSYAVDDLTVANSLRHCDRSSLPQLAALLDGCEWRAPLPVKAAERIDMLQRLRDIGPRVREAMRAAVERVKAYAERKAEKASNVRRRGRRL